MVIESDSGIVYTLVLEGSFSHGTESLFQAIQELQFTTADWERLRVMMHHRTIPFIDEATAEMAGGDISGRRL